MPAYSNFAEIAQANRRVAAALDPQRIGPELLAGLARRLWGRAAVRNTGPSGIEWDAPAESTLAWKARKGYPPIKGYATGHMWDEAQFVGQQSVARDSARMTYGLDRRAQDELGYFSEGTIGPGRRVQPPRPGAYELDPDDEEWLDREHERIIDEWMDSP